MNAELEFQRIRDAIAQGDTDEAFDIADRAWRTLADTRAAESLASEGEAQPVAVSVQDPLMILAGIRQFGLASDGSDLRDLEAVIAALAAPRGQSPMNDLDVERLIAKLTKPHRQIHKAANRVVEKSSPAIQHKAAAALRILLDERSSVPGKESPAPAVGEAVAETMQPGCTHADYDFAKHGRYCHCGELMTDCGD